MCSQRSILFALCFLSFSSFRAIWWISSLYFFCVFNNTTLFVSLWIHFCNYLVCTIFYLVFMAFVKLFLQFRTHKVIYRRYAGLFFSLCVDITDNELAYLESIHLFVEILDHFFSNVCELDLVFNFHKVCCCFLLILFQFN